MIPHAETCCCTACKARRRRERTKHEAPKVPTEDGAFLVSPEAQYYEIERRMERYRLEWLKRRRK